MDDKVSENIILDSKRMFEHACAFCDCAKFCEVESSNIEYRMRSHTVSGIVNSAFACEIFIKTLLVFHGRTIMDIKGHELKLLWEKFKKEDYETSVYVEKGICEWFRTEDENLFDRLIGEASNAFEYWRYIYEKQEGTINMNFLLGFRYRLREVCCKKLFGKSWNEYKSIE